MRTASDMITLLFLFFGSYYYVVFGLHDLSTYLKWPNYTALPNSLCCLGPLTDAPKVPPKIIFSPMKHQLFFGSSLVVQSPLNSSLALHCIPFFSVFTWSIVFAPIKRDVLAIGAIA